MGQCDNSHQSSVEVRPPPPMLGHLVHSYSGAREGEGPCTPGQYSEKSPATMHFLKRTSLLVKAPVSQAGGPPGGRRKDRTESESHKLPVNSLKSKHTLQDLPQLRGGISQSLT